MSLDNPEETPQLKPYLVRAVWQCCTDFGYTPYVCILVDDYTQVPENYVQNGAITLNIGHSACAQLNLADDFLSCKLRFGGKPFDIVVPIGRIQTIYARENIEIGMHFAVEETSESAQMQNKHSPKDSHHSGIRLVD